MARSNPIFRRKIKRSPSPTIPQPPKPKRAKKSTPIKPFRFWELPGELRNKIYESVASTTQGEVLYLVDGGTSDDSKLLAAGASYYVEYRPILLKHIKRIETEVIDFDFRHIVAFVNNLSDGELKSLSATHAHKARPLCIELEINPVTGSPPVQRLLSWLDGMAATKKIGAKFATLEIKYSLKGNYTKHNRPPSRDLHLRPHSSFRYHNLYTWAEQLDRKLEFQKKPRVREEALKIRQLFDPYV